jgi:hypothetical protein
VAKNNRSINKRPRLFRPSVVRNESKIAMPSKLDLKKLSETNFESTSSFRYDSTKSPLKSTQEIPLDWSKFQNHTFFNSAESKVNIAFERIINEYPFDGMQREVEAFEDSLTGYEKYILEIFPKSTGFLHFSGTLVNENPGGGSAALLGTHIPVQDRSGLLFPGFSKVNTGKSAIDFGQSSFSIEMHLYPSPQANTNQIVCQKRASSDKSITLAISESLSSTKCDLLFSVVSGSSNLFVTSSIEKGVFSHICATYERASGLDNLKIYVSESLVASSSNSIEMGSLSFNSSDFIIGSGSSFNVPGWSTPLGTTSFVPTTTLSGAMDELRVFHSLRSKIDQKSSAISEIYPDPDNNLRLYLKFNEPTGSFNLSDVVLDSSGNSLHSRIKNYNIQLRLSGSVDNPITSDESYRNPVLFPSYYRIADLNSKLLTSASLYDDKNPNIITKLIPIHNLLDGQYSQGLGSVEGDLGAAISGNSIPGSAEIGSAQYLTAFLLIWAKFYDEMKIFVDHFSRLLTVDYDSNESITEKFLPYVAEYYGFDLPSLFPNADPTQMIEGKNIQSNYSKASQSLSYVQNMIWKRILININDITTSKGTIHSIKALLRSSGINPDSLLSIREYGGPTKRSLVGRREVRSEVATSIDFSGSIGLDPGAFLPTGFSLDRPRLVSGYLSSSRIEAGFPEPVGSMVFKQSFSPHGISNDKSDGLLTSGSFTYEGIYQFDSRNKHPANQSLARLHVTGASAPSSTHGVLTNLMFVSGTRNSLTSSGGDLRLYVRSDTNSTTSPTLTLILSGLNIFDGNKWSVSFGRVRSDDTPETKTSKYLAGRASLAQSSSYFLRCARQSYGTITENYLTSAFFMEAPVVASAHNPFQKVTPALNASGAFVVIGSQSLAGGSSNLFLNASTTPADCKVTEFTGRVSQMRFWSKALDEKSWLEHVRNYKSLGVDNPIINFNFETKATGSFSRLRMNTSTDQKTLNADSSGDIKIFDFSQNNIHLSGSGFEKSKAVITSDTFYFSQLAPGFDLSQTDNKVRVRSFQNPENISLSPYSNSAPVYEVRKSEEPDDDTRLSIEFSSVRGLNEDIMRMFGSLEFFDDALGYPNLQFDDFYPDLDQLRKIYFNRLEEKPDLQIFFDMFKWFTTAYSELIEQLVPKKTKYLGVNFIIESHVLERNKFRYLFDEIYLKSLERDNSRGSLLLSQIVGSIKKY